MVTSVTKGGTQKLPQRFEFVETYWHDHSLESSWGALSDGTISLSIPPLSGEKCISWIFLQETSVLIKSWCMLYYYIVMIRNDQNDQDHSNNIPFLDYMSYID
jgi:hypothetical protein